MFGSRIPKFCEQGQRSGLGDFDLCELTGQGLGTIEDDDVVVRGAADELGVVLVFGLVQVRLFAGALDEDFHGLAQEAFVVLIGDLADDFQQLNIALLFDLGRDAVLKFFL